MKQLHLDYWKEALSVALEDAGGITLTPDQQEQAAKALLISHEMMGTAFGYDCIPDPRSTEIKRLKRESEKEHESYEQRERVLMDALKKSYATSLGCSPENLYIRIEKERVEVILR